MATEILEINTGHPMTVTGSKNGKNWIALKMQLVDGRKISIPMHIMTAKGIGLTLTKIADGLAIENDTKLSGFTVKDENLN